MRKPVGKSVRLVAGLLLAALLGGCAEPLQERQPPEGAPDDIAIGVEAPQADAIAEREMQAVLYYPSVDGAHLRAEVAPVMVRGGEEEAEAVLRALLGAAPPPGLRSAAPGVTLEAVERPVVVSGEVATVTLSAEARLLTPRELCAARMAIANTLTELADIAYVNVLVEGVEEGLDLSGTLPAGALIRRSDGDIDAVWRQIEGQQEEIGRQSFSKLVTVYVPAPGGRYIVPQVRSVAFSDARPAALAMGVLSEVARGAIGLEGAPALPDLPRYLTGEPEVLQQANASSRTIRLNFDQALEQALLLSGISKGMLCAALTQSVATFVPGVRGVQIRLGVDALIELRAEESLNGRAIALPDDLWTPALFWDDVGAFANVALPVSGGDRLARVSRPVQATRRMQPRYLLEQLFLGPQRADVREDLSPAMPGGVGTDDLLAVALQGDMALVNLSGRFAAACAGLDAAGERNAIYAIVNTLSEFPRVRRVAFFIEGEQSPQLAGALETRGFFLRNPGLFLQ